MQRAWSSGVGAWVAPWVMWRGVTRCAPLSPRWRPTCCPAPPAYMLPGAAGHADEVILAWIDGRIPGEVAAWLRICGHTLQELEVAP